MANDGSSFSLVLTSCVRQPFLHILATAIYHYAVSISAFQSIIILLCTSVPLYCLHPATLFSSPHIIHHADLHCYHCSLVLCRDFSSGLLNNRCSRHPFLRCVSSSLHPVKGIDVDHLICTDKRCARRR